MDGEVNGIAHIRAAVVVTDGPCGECYVGKEYLLIVVSQEYSGQYVHFFNNHLRIGKKGNNIG